MSTTNNDVACVRYECSNEAYHADLDAVSNSMLSTFIDSPELYYGRYVSKQYPHEASDALDLGTVVHDAVLCGGGLSSLCLPIPDEVLDSAGARKGKAWKEFAAINEGMILLKAKDFASVRCMYDGIMCNEKARFILEAEGPVEHNWKWNCSLTSMARRARLDKFAERLMLIGDLKTTSDISPRGFIASVAKYRYFVQQVYYQDAIEAETGDMADFVFIAVEKNPPYRCRCFDLKDDDGIWIQRGEQIKNEKLVELAERKRTNCWTAPDSNLIVTLGAPYWLSNPDQWNLAGAEAE